MNSRGSLASAFSETESPLSDIGEKVLGAFKRDRTILSYHEYLQLVRDAPRIHLRNSAQYVKDVFDYFGSYREGTPSGPIRRFRLFDLEWENGNGRVAGQEEVQNGVYRVLANFVRIGKVNKLILLHGPNGSAKSSIVSAIMQGMEQYSHIEAGALYRFYWVFPSEKAVRGASLGFHDRPLREEKATQSYAHMEGDALDARISCELKDHPILLVPRAERAALLEPIIRDLKDFNLANYLIEGDLCHKCKQIFTALLGAYRGDYLKVLRHIQVERFYVDRKYLQSAATVEPQLSVDAACRQVTADRSTANLPASLHNVALLEPLGPLVHANRGIIEYSDLLKRPIEAFRYLLGMSETASVSMEHFVLKLDQVLISSANDKHLNAFKELPDFASFKGRVELVRVPYLRSSLLEQQIYDQQVTDVAVGRHVAPHSTQVAAIWGVLTRLKKPVANRYSGEVADLVDDLSPLEKLRLYDRGESPDRLSMSQAKELKNRLPQIYQEADGYPRYEGSCGASARELKTALFNAAQSSETQCLTPFLVLQELRSLCKDKSIYEFLQQEAIDSYHDHESLIDVVEAECVDLVDQEVRDCMGLISETQYRELFEKYIQHVSQWVKGEKVHNRITGEYEKPSETIMRDMELIVMPADQERGDYRRGLISSIGAFKLDHPQDEVDYGRVFPEIFKKLRDHYFDERKKSLYKNAQNVLKYLSEDQKELSVKEKAQTENALKMMKEKYHYCDRCAKDAVVFLMRKRYTK